MANNELKICQQLKADCLLPYFHLGSAYLALDSSRQAKDAFNMGYELIKKSKNFSDFQDYLVYLLCDYSELEDKEKAKECFSLIKMDPLVDYSAFACMTFALYYECLGKNDSARIYCKRILDDGTDLNNMYDAAKLLYRNSKKAGDKEAASRYADVYMHLSDSLDFGKRQELAATVNNQYKYHLDQNKEQKLKDEKEKYKNTIFIISVVAILLFSISYILYIKRRNKHLQEIITLSAELQRFSDTDTKLRESIKKKEQELEQTKNSLEKSAEELDHVKREFLRVNKELSDYSTALKEKEHQLAEKIEQNRTFIQLLHQSDLESKSEDVIEAVKKSSAGKREMNTEEWKRLYKAVDELYPLFRNRLVKTLGTFNEKQMQVCYLMRAGLTKLQIKNITDLSRVTIWRWVKKYNWVMTPDDANNTQS